MSKQKVSKSYPTSHFLHELLSINKLEENESLSNKIVVGIGGAGSNIVSQLNKSPTNFGKLTTIAINTDATHLRNSDTDKKILIGLDITNGKGTGNDPSKGEISILNNLTMIVEEIKDADMVILITGLGGGTGTGATPILARYLKMNNIPSVTICTFPFPIEGVKKINSANNGLRELLNFSQSLVILPNEIIFSDYDNHSVKSAFSSIDFIVKNLIELMVEGIDNRIIVENNEYNGHKIKSKLDKLNNYSLRNYQWDYRKYPTSHVFYLLEKEIPVSQSNKSD